MNISPKTIRRLMLAPLLLSASVFAANITVTGQVMAAGGQNGLAGVDVTVMGTDVHTTTSADGTYTLQVPEDATLMFSIEGWPGQEIRVDGQTKIDVTFGM